MNTLLAFKREQLVYTGTEHQYTYLKDDEKDKVFDPFTSPDIYYI